MTPPATLQATELRHGRQSVALETGVRITCVCGQDLDCCHGAHCPRCGVTLG